MPHPTAGPSLQTRHGWCMAAPTSTASALSVQPERLRQAGTCRPSDPPTAHPIRSCLSHSPPRLPPCPWPTQPCLAPSLHQPARGSVATARRRQEQCGGGGGRAARCPLATSDGMQGRAALPALPWGLPRRCWLAGRAARGLWPLVSYCCLLRVCLARSGRPWSGFGRRRER